MAWGTDLQSEHERFISEQVIKGPVVITDYPRDIKAFYMRLNDDEKTVAAMDVLVPGVGEIIGGSQREERLSVLDARMDEHLKEELWWYRDLRRYGTVHRPVWASNGWYCTSRAWRTSETPFHFRGYPTMRPFVAFTLLGNGIISFAKRTK